MSRRFLVTGGAGYVGSHLVLALAERGEEVVVLDDLRQGHRAAVPAGIRVIEAGAGIRRARCAARGRPVGRGVPFRGAVAGRREHARAVPLSNREHDRHGVRLIEACVRHGVRRFVLSSTAALFGTPETIPIPEQARVDPGSPYGESKWMIERALLWADRIHGLRSACLPLFQRRRRRSGWEARRGPSPGDASHSAHDRRGARTPDRARGVRQRLRDAGRDLHPRLHSRLRSRRGASAGAAAAR